MNERAAIAGELDEIATQRAELAKRLARAQVLVARLTARSEWFTERAAVKRSCLEGLTATIVMVHSQVNPAAAGVVHAWAGKYGKPGGLTAFLIQCLQDAAPGPRTTTNLVDEAIHHFGLVIENATDRVRLRHTVSNKLREFHVKGLTVPRHDRTKSTSGVWAWKGLPTLPELSDQATRDQSHDLAEPPQSNPARHQVAAQRAVGNHG